MPDSQNKRTAWEFFVNNRKFVSVLCIAIAVLGMIAVISIPKRSTPKADFPIFTITTSYPGADPADVEELVTNPIEDEVLGINQIKKTTSKSYQGFSSISLEFKVEADKDEKMNEVEEAVNRAAADFPANVNDPRINDISPSEILPVLRFSLSGPYDVNRLQDMAEELKDELKRIPNVSAVNISGGEERVFKVLVNKSALDHFGLGLGQVTDAIKAANSNIPVGSIQTGGANYTVKLEGEVVSAGEIKNIPVTSRGESVVYVRDVAEVKDTFRDRSSISRLSREGGKANPAVSMSVVKSGEGGNILSIVDKAREEIDKAKGSILPGNVQVEIVNDQAESIGNDIRNLADNGLQTMAIIIVLLVLFVGWREALLSAISVPLTFLISFTVLDWAGYTMNFLTLFALVLSLGILVDSFIVITEGVNRKIRQGAEAMQAVVGTIREYYLPLTTGVLTTISVFLPMLLTSGVIGEFIKSLPVTVTITLLAALFVALGVVTGLSTKFLTLGRRHKNRQAGREFYLDKKVLPFYTRILEFFFYKRYRRALAAIVLAGLFVAAMLLPAQGILEQDLFPEQDQDYFAVNIKTPAGMPLEETSHQAAQVEKVFLGDKRIKSFQTNVGSQFHSFISLSPGGENLAHIIVNLKDSREAASFEIAAEYRDKLGQMDFFPTEVKVVQLTAGPPSGSPVTINLTGPSLVELDRLSSALKDKLAATPGAVNVATSKEESNGQFAISINRDKAQMYGIKTSQVAGILRNAVHGSEATVVREGEDDTEVTVKYDLGGQAREDRADVDDISSLTVATPAGDIPLSTFITTRLESQRSFIQHQDGKRIVQITSDSTNQVSPVTISSAMKQKIEGMDMPSDYEVAFGGEMEDIQQSFHDMLQALLLGVFVIAMLMVLQFKSYRQPVFILVSIPLSVIGIFPGLVLVGQSLSFPAVIGIVALAGIVVNNAILLIDAINQYRLRGWQRTQAIIAACQVRFQPVLLTAATTIGGMIPLVFTNPTWAPIAYSIIFGLFFSTVLTLVVIPLLYYSWGEKEL